MKIWRRLHAGCLGLALVVAGCGGSGPAGIPEGYPGDYGRIVDAAEKEGALVLWSSTDKAQVGDLLAGFRKKYPQVPVTYREMRALNMYNWFLGGGGRKGQPAPDLIWSSAMDLQIKLVNDGYAQSYASPESPGIAGWANWKNQAWGITAEPIVLVYNRRLVPPGSVPRSHLEFRRLLEADAASLKGHVATYDPAQSAFGYLILAQDDLASPDIWRTVRALGANDVRLLPTTKAIIADVAAGKVRVGYNVLGSYAAESARRNPDLGVVLPRDYTLVASRIAMIPRTAVHANAARLFLDYLLSREGQRALAKHSMPSVRADVAPPRTLEEDGASIRAIRVGPALLVTQDQLSRAHFMRQWNAALAAGREHGPDRFGT